jgi:hypothetical protein
MKGIAMYKRSDILKITPKDEDINKVHAREDWKTSIQDDFYIGALIDEEIVNDLMNVVPPRTLNADMVQMGEVYSHILVNDKVMRTFFTVARTEQGWVYCGICLPGKIQNVVEI